MTLHPEGAAALEKVCPVCNGPAEIDTLRRWDRSSGAWFDVVQRRCVSTKTISREQLDARILARVGKRGRVSQHCNHVEDIEAIPRPDIPPPSIAAPAAPSWRTPTAAKPPRSTPPTTREEQPPMAKSDPKYSPELKKKYVDLVLDGKMTVAEASKASDIWRPTLQAYVSDERQRRRRAAAQGAPPEAKQVNVLPCHGCRKQFDAALLPTKDEAGNLHCADCTPAVFRARATEQPPAAAPPATSAPAAEEQPQTFLCAECGVWRDLDEKRKCEVCPKVICLYCARSDSEGIDFCEPCFVHVQETGRRELAEDASIIRDMLLLVGVDVHQAVITSWSDEQRREASQWASATHLSASDHDDVVIPPRPDFLPSLIPTPTWLEKATESLQQLKASTSHSEESLRAAADTLEGFGSYAHGADERSARVRALYKRRDVARLIMSDDIAKFAGLPQDIQETILYIVRAPADQW